MFNYLVNFYVSGLTVDQDALVKALQSGVIRAAALDVTHPEPLPRYRLFENIQTLFRSLPVYIYSEARLTFFFNGLKVESTDETSVKE